MSTSEPTWHRVGRAGEGGTVASLAAVADTVFAATPAGIRRSADNGQTWTAAGTPTNVPLAEAIATSPRFERDRTVLAGAADALYRSTDAGETWQRVVLGAVLAVVAAPGLWLAGTESDGVLRSEDNGQRWTGANAGLLDLTVTALAVSPSFETDRTAILGTTSGLYRTRNGARAWRAAMCDVDEPAVQCLAMSPSFADDHLAFAGTEADGLLKSEDGGATWTVVPELDAHGVTALVFAPDGAVAVATDSGIRVSRDAGQSWRQAKFDGGPVLSLLVTGERLLAGLAGNGLALSDDSGQTWRSTTAELNANLLLALAASPHFATDRTLFVAGPQEGVRASTDAGRTWRNHSADLPDTTVLGLAVTPSHLVAATPDGLLRSGLGEPRWQPCLEEPVRVVAAQPGSALLVAATQERLVLSSDEGQTWRNVDAEFAANVISVAIASDGTLYVGTARPTGDIAVWRSTDHGSTWRRWLLDRATGGILPIAVAPAQTTDESVFIGIDNRVLHPIRNTREVRGGERRPLWRSVPLGDASNPVTALCTHRGAVLAATSAGAFVSFDGADTFQRLDAGLPRLPFVALAATDADVYALALGGSLWRATIALGGALIDHLGPPTKGDS